MLSKKSTKKKIGQLGELQTTKKGGICPLTNQVYACMILSFYNNKRDLNDTFF